METLAIQIEVKKVYGVDTFYPLCDTSKLFTRLTRRITLSHSDLKTIQDLGYKIEVAHPSFSF